MEKVDNSCFSTKKVAADLNESVKNFRKTFLATEVSDTLKIHVVTQHLNHCLDYLSGYGLGVWSEQAGEAVHTEFDNFWDRYKINNIEDPLFLSQLKKAVIEFSSLYI